MRKKKKVRIKWNRVIIALFILVSIVFIPIKLFFKNTTECKEEVYMTNFVNKSLGDLKTYAKEYDLKLEITYDYDDDIEKDYVVSQSILENNEIKKGDILRVVVSLGELDLNKLKKDNINELGEVPIMMYHNIIDKPSSETNYTGGNVDKDGYNRTTEAFREDLEMYYQKGYRMIRLIDYVRGNIDTAYGKSPIVLTFDDGNDNNIKVTGLDSDGNIIIDPSSAVGILEEFKKKYPDYNVTATFFITSSIFNQKEYNEKILKWLVEHGYDVGNHTVGHNNLNSTTITKTQEVIAKVYKQLDEIIPNKYVKILALPYGNPTSKKHENYPYVIKGTYEDYTYETEASLRVGWKPEVSPFDKDFDKTYIKRCRAYDNNGKEFDIDMVFNSILKDLKYVSDGDPNTITVPKEYEKYLNDNNLYKILY